MDFFSKNVSIIFFFWSPIIHILCVCMYTQFSLFFDVLVLKADSKLPYNFSNESSLCVYLDTENTTKKSRKYQNISVEGLFKIFDKLNCIKR